MADGAGLEGKILDAIVTLTAEVNHLKGLIKGMVDYDKLAEHLTEHRRENEARAEGVNGSLKDSQKQLEDRLMAIIRDEIAGVRQERNAEIASVAKSLSDESLKPRVGAMATAAAKATIAEEYQITRRAQMAMIGGGSVGLLGGGYALARSLWGG